LKDAYLQPVAFNTAPGAEYADAARMFQGIPSIARTPGGRLWAVWYGGGVTEDEHNYVMSVTSTDDGQTWSNLVFVLDPDGPGPVRTFDAVPWIDPQGRMWLFWSQGEHGKTPPNCRAWAAVTDDPESPCPSWSAPQKIARGVIMNQPIVRSDGVWLAVPADWQAEPSCTVCASSDAGRTFEVIGGATVPDPADRSADEHMLIERTDGTLWMLVRTNYGIGESTSADGGRTWKPVTPSPLGHTTSRFHLRRLRSGRLLLVKHGQLHQRGDRCDLTAYLSDDGGHSWHGRLMIDERLGVSYPDADEAPDGTSFLIYDYNRTTDKEILLARFTEQDVESGCFQSPHSAQRLLVNKATGQRS